jgi:glycosyltransferase involved in cell wall biosynthesis
MKRLLVSVIIPCYNRADVIHRAVTSALKQTHGDLEVIVVDDASEERQDPTSAIREIGDPRVRVVRHEQNLGGAAARNTGVAHANGLYIAFLDSDDEWLPTKLERQLSLAREQTGSNWLIYTQSEVHTTQASEAKQSVMPLRAIGKAERVGDYLFNSKGWLPTPAMFLPRSLALEIPFNPELRRHQDYDFLLRLEAYGCRFLMIPETLVIVHWEDLHQSARGLNPANSLAFLKQYQNFLSPRARTGFVFGQVVMRLLGAGRRLAAVRHFLRYVRPWHLTPVQHVSLLSALIFRDARIARMLADLKRCLRRNRRSESLPS